MPELGFPPRQSGSRSCSLTIKLHSLLLSLGSRKYLGRSGFSLFVSFWIKFFHEGWAWALLPRGVSATEATLALAAVVNITHQQGVSMFEDLTLQRKMSWWVGLAQTAPVPTWKASWGIISFQLLCRERLFGSCWLHVSLQIPFCVGRLSVSSGDVGCRSGTETSVHSSLTHYSCLPFLHKFGEEEIEIANAGI